ncbi:hypothetical protein LMUP508_01991 [Limosilactobacillus mucosae]|uniref:Uncharacterized protein n=1 Tax=Limosilactobacillus mucosae TaxID=97478 RepID=A0A508YYD9_LIMMU|nr:hypothetical protein LMUP508_01991 [Limosilactobacillus mucosae]
MGKILSVAKMVFKKRSLSPTYYWMILAPIVVAIIGICFAKSCSIKVQVNDLLLLLLQIII